jgi:hypothetical protein
VRTSIDVYDEPPPEAFEGDQGLDAMRVERARSARVVGLLTLCVLGAITLGFLVAAVAS